MSNEVLLGLTGVGKVLVHRNICLGAGETPVCHGVGEEGSLLAQQCPTPEHIFRKTGTLGELITMSLHRSAESSCTLDKEIPQAEPSCG